jgi:hypothetical protein
MTHFNESKMASDRGMLRRFLIPVVVFFLAAGAGLLIFPVVRWLHLMHELQGTSKAVSPAEASASVGRSLMSWGVTVGSMRAINGFTESDGFHGDGTDWYELELGAYSADDLRLALGATAGITQSKQFPRESTAPPWWPTHWPSDAQCYRRNLEYLILPDTGTKAWFMRMRT